jgi:hypothetical protein
MSSTPLVRSNDHAETLATSIVEAVLALEIVSCQALPQASENRSTTPNVDRGSDQSTTPFNPIPNATPGAPRVSVGLQEKLHPFSTDQVQFIRRPLTFQGEITPIRPADESFTMKGLSAEGNDVLIESFKVKYDSLL